MTDRESFPIPTLGLTPHKAADICRDPDHSVHKLPVDPCFQITDEEQFQAFAMIMDAYFLGLLDV